MDLIDASDSEDEDRLKKKIKLAGTAHSDMGERSAKPVVKINALDFNPTGAISCFYKMNVGTVRGIGGGVHVHEVKKSSTYQF